VTCDSEQEEGREIALAIVLTQKSMFLGFFAVLGFELRAYSLSHSTSPFLVLDTFEIGSCELLAWTGFKS
jgi:hypothetical protein